ncbi:hypothetical protein V8J88_06835 [Massilia sp. W12]|uniref:hypothetical protein n=1 Tax=Massilia sp. W12 TaxID=3126507 RepID=UPI0030D29601
MFFGFTPVLHSRLEDGRHWFTTMDVTPLQLLPLAPNQYRAGNFLLSLLTSKLEQMAQEADADAPADFPYTLCLSRADVAACSALTSDYPELADSAASVSLVLDWRPGPQATHQAAQEEEGHPLFITPLPGPDWAGDYASWITFCARALGQDLPSPANSYETELAHAQAQVQALLPALRARYLNGMDGLNLGLKIALPTSSGGLEYVWVRPIDWSTPEQVICTLESEPYDCPAYVLGQTMQCASSAVLDYGVGSEEAGLLESGPTQKIAENYGML